MQPVITKLRNIRYSTLKGVTFTGAEAVAAATSLLQFCLKDNFAEVTGVPTSLFGCTLDWAYKYTTPTDTSVGVIIGTTFSAVDLSSRKVNTDTEYVPGNTFLFSKARKEIFEYLLGNTSVIIPSAINGTPVLSIGAETFLGNTVITSVIIPTSVASIGNNAFQGCSALADVTIPLSVTAIGDGAFAGTAIAGNFVLSNNITTLGGNAFTGTGITSLVFPSSLTSIPPSIFSHCYELTNVTLPPNLISIGQEAFNACSNLQSINIPPTVTSLEVAAFNFCEKLTSIVLPLGLTSIEVTTFQGCKALTSIVLPPGITRIPMMAFRWCESLTSINFENITSIGYDAFRDCASLTELIFTNPNIQFAGDSFSNCVGVTNIELPNGAYTIGARAFTCPNLRTVTIHAIQPPNTGDNSGVFVSYHSSLVIRVPAGSVNMYKTYSGWSMYASRIVAI